MAVNRQVARHSYRVCTGLYRPLSRSSSVSMVQKVLVRPPQDVPGAEEQAEFSRAGIGGFFQERPMLKNPFLEDALLQGYLRRHLPSEVCVYCVCHNVSEWIETMTMMFYLFSH